MASVYTLFVMLLAVFHLSSAAFTGKYVEHYFEGNDCASLIARCTDEKVLERASKLDLNGCFSNNDGKLVPAKKGRAFGNRCGRHGFCENCQIEGADIKCDCPKRNKQYRSTLASLDEFGSR
ncbi:hypothetical protein BDV06DRAFT_193767 [Aspergillus oleicola]